MRRWQAFLSIAIATFWVAVGSHCLLEMLPGLEFLSCCQHSQAERCSAHDDNECAGDGCAAIESGLYKTEKSQVAPARPLIPLVAWLDALSGEVQFHTPEFPVIASNSPPELLRAWQFSQRTALPPRAPSFVS
jgi:hypothetical protein